MKEKINSLQLCSMFITMVVASFLGVGIYTSIKMAGVDAYLSIIICAVIGLILLPIFKIIFDYEPNLTFSQKINKLFGKKVGIIINILFIVNGLLLGATAFFNLTSFISSQILPQTPKLLIGILFAGLVIFINTKNLETLSRVCFIIVVINFTLFLIAIANLIFKIDPLNLAPFLNKGILPPFKGSIYLCALNFFPTYLFLIIPKNCLSDKEKVKKRIPIAFLLSAIVMFLVSFITMGVLGIELSEFYQYPEYIVLKRVNYFDFLNQIENILNIQWIFGLFFNISFVVYYIRKSINLKSKNKIIPTSIVVAILALYMFIFKDSVSFNNFLIKNALYTRLFFFLILLMMSIVIKIKRCQSIKTN